MTEKLNKFFTDIIFISTGKQVIPLQETNHEEAISDIRPMKFWKYRSGTRTRTLTKKLINRHACSKKHE